MELFAWSNIAYGLFSIRSIEHGKYLSLSDGGDLIVSKYKFSWAIISSSGGVFIQSDGYKLSCDDNGKLYTTENSSGGWETWRLEAILPGATMNGKQILTLLGASASVAGLAIITPVALSFAVKRGNFDGAEIVVKGSIVTGTMAVKSCKAAFQNDQGLISCEHSEEQLPLCSWRMWK